MNEIQIAVSGVARKNGQSIQIGTSYNVSIDENLKVLVDQGQSVGLTPEPIAYGDVGIVHESILILRNTDEAKTVYLRRSDADFGFTMRPGESFGPARVDGPLLNVLRLQASGASALVEVWLAQTTEIIP